MRGFHYKAANHCVGNPELEERAAPLDTDFEYSPSLAARFPSALRNKTLVGEAAGLAYHFWESKGCPPASHEEEEIDAAICAAR